MVDLQDAAARMYAAKKFINTKYKVLLIEQDSYLGGVLKNSNKIKTKGS